MDDLLINGDDEDSVSYNSEEESEEDNDQMIVSESDGWINVFGDFLVQ